MSIYIYIAGVWIPVCESHRGGLGGPVLFNMIGLDTSQCTKLVRRYLSVAPTGRCGNQFSYYVWFCMGCVKVREGVWIYVRVCESVKMCGWCGCVLGCMTLCGCVNDADVCGYLKVCGCVRVCESV